MAGSTSSFGSKPSSLTPAEPHNVAGLADGHDIVMPAELEQTVRLATIGSMAAGVAHEINNLLTPVLAYAQMSQTDPELMPKAIEKTIAGVQTACQIVDAILGFARDSAEPGVACDIEAVLDASLSCLARDLEKDRIVLIRDLETGLMPAIPPMILQQVLLNLVLNAREAILGAKGRRVLRVESRSTPAGGIEIRVSDTGPGISPAVAAKIFEPFITTKVPSRPAGDDTTIQTGGSGLGLSVCRHLLQKHAGTIEVDPTYTDGAMFHITLRAA
jgi:signal transduction histidine kinase